MKEVHTQTNTIYLTRGQPIALPFKIKNYTFSEGDIVEFKVYEEYALDSPPLLVIKKVVESETDIVYLDLKSQDTINFPLANEPVKYWYEIDLNKNNVVLGFDKKRAKKLVLYPKGIDAKEEENNE